MQNALLELVPAQPESSLSRLIEMALATCPSPATRRLYGVQLRKFVASNRPLTREGVALYIQSERDRGMSGGSITAAMSAIRKLVSEANIRGLMTREQMDQIGSIRSGTNRGVHSGMWLTIAQVRRLRNLPDRKTFWGKRDACMLSLFLGCGLRRLEMANLTWDHYQERDGRPCLVDFVGKGRKTRTVPVPVWAVEDVETWRKACRQPQPVPVGLDARVEANRARDFDFICAGMKEDTIHQKVRLYGERMKLELSPHDLRRTLAQMLRRAGAPLEQIQATLGHESLKTTEIYLGSRLELTAGLASVDKLELEREEAEEEAPEPEPEPEPEEASAGLGQASEAAIASSSLEYINEIEEALGEE